MITNILTLILAFISIASAKITGFATPKYPIHAGDTFPVTFYTNTDDWPSAQYYALFGLQPQTPSTIEPSTIYNLAFGPGTDLVAAGHSKSSAPGSFTIDLTLDPSFTSTDTTWVVKVAILESASRPQFKT